MQSDHLITSRGDFHAALRVAFDEAAGTGCRELLIADTDFADWPLGDRDLIASLTAWAAAHRQLVVLATHFDAVVRQHPRWAEWRRTWSHIVDCRVNDELEAGQMPTMLLAPGLVGVRLVDPIHHRGRLSHEAGDLLRWREDLDAVLQRSSPSFPATLLGI
jgi:hypothetical protein